MLSAYKAKQIIIVFSASAGIVAQVGTYTKLKRMEGGDGYTSKLAYEYNRATYIYATWSKE